MDNPEILAHIQKLASEGMPEDQIREELLSKGYPKEDVNGSLAFLNVSRLEPGTSHDVPQHTSNTAFSKKKIFLEIFLVPVIIILVCCAGAFFYLYWQESMQTAQGDAAFKEIVQNGFSTNAFNATPVSPPTIQNPQVAVTNLTGYAASSTVGSGADTSYIATQQPQSSLISTITTAVTAVTSAATEIITGTCPSEDTGTYPNCIAPSSTNGGGGGNVASAGTDQTNSSLPQTPISQVASGCAMPSNKVGTAFYIDPINGSDSGDGSQAHPWKTLQDVIDAGLISTMPTHAGPAPTYKKILNNPDAPIQPGDTIYLMSGDEGTVVLQGAYTGANIPSIGYNNNDFITIKAYADQVPQIENLTIVGGAKWIFQGITFESLNNSGKIVGTVNPDYWLVKLQGSHNNILFDHDTFMSQPDVTDWTPTDWLEKRASGIEDVAYGDCDTISNNLFKNIGFGIQTQRSNDELIAGNTIDYFSDDGIDYGSNNLVIENNTITNSIEDGDGFHRDGMQGQPADTAPLSNVTITNNSITRETDPNIQNPGNLQGIDTFDGVWNNITVTNNQVITNATQGISYYGVNGIVISNNILLADSGRILSCLPWGAWGCSIAGQHIVYAPPYGTSTPSIVVTNSKAGVPSGTISITDNIMSGLDVSASSTEPITISNNLCVPTNVPGKCVMGYPVDGKEIWKGKPGNYPGNNLIPTFSASDLFTQYDPVDMSYNLTLKMANPALSVSVIHSPKNLTASVETAVTYFIHDITNIMHF